jgi:hypothetical protein
MKSSIEQDRRHIDIECDCMDIDHMIRFAYYDESEYGGNESYGPDDMLYFTCSLNPNRPFIYRVWAALKYIFNVGAYTNIMFGESLLLPSDGRDLTQFLQKYNDYIERNNLFR